MKLYEGGQGHSDEQTKYSAVMTVICIISGMIILLGLLIFK